MNFKQPCWLTLLISLALIPLCYGGVKVMPAVFRFLHIDNGKPPGPMDLIELSLLLLMVIASLVAVIALIWCVLTVVRSEKAKKILYGKR